MICQVCEIEYIIKFAYWINRKTNYTILVANKE